MGRLDMPTWPAASSVYSRACAILALMAKSGHVQKVRKGGRQVGAVRSPEMESFIDALNRGDEEAIRGCIAAHDHLLYKKTAQALLLQGAARRSCGHSAKTRRGAFPRHL